METDSKGEEDDGGAGDTRIAPMIIELHSYVFLGTYDRACKKNNGFVFVLINLTVIVGVRGDKECLCCSGPKLGRWLTGIFVPVILGCR